jgi:hypothetical protein
LVTFGIGRGKTVGGVVVLSSGLGSGGVCGGLISPRAGRLGLGGLVDSLCLVGGTGDYLERVIKLLVVGGGGSSVVPLCLCCLVGRTVVNGSLGDGLGEVIGGDNGLVILGGLVQLGQTSVSNGGIAGRVLGLDSRGFSGLSRSLLLSSLLAREGAKADGSLLDLRIWSNVSNKTVGQSSDLLTLDRQQFALNRGNLLVRTCDQVHNSINGLVITSVDQQQCTFECLGLIRVGLLFNNTLGSGSSEELAEGAQLLAQGRVELFLELVLEISLQLLDLTLVGRSQARVLSGHARLVVGIDLLVLGNLFFELSERGLESGLLGGLSLLVGVDLAGFEKFVQRLARVLGEDRVQLGHGVLSLVNLVWSGSGRQARD